MKTVNMAKCGTSYAVVSVMGPQSSGKSTLVNRLFGTNFKEMNALDGRLQTTKGIWLENCVRSKCCTLVMDLEGSDGRERGEDDTTFEKQSALFALVLSDIVLINMCCNAIGCEQAASKPLLKIIFQVMMRLFGQHKTTLMFVIRDKTPTPLEKLELMLKEDIQKIWNSIPKTPDHTKTPLSDIFNIEVVAFSHYEHCQEQFQQEVVSLRERFFHSIIPGVLAGDRRSVVDASCFSSSTQKIWDTIKMDKDLDLPAHKVMMATVRCEEISKEKFAWFSENEDWCQVKDDVQDLLVPGFGKKLNPLLNKCLSQYDKEATYFDEGVRNERRKQLEGKLLQLIQPAYQSMVEHIQSRTLDKFKEAFDNDLKGGKIFLLAVHECTESTMTQFEELCADAVINIANWDTLKLKIKLRLDINAHVAYVRPAKVSELIAVHEAKLKEAVSVQVKALLDGAGNNTWQSIREYLQHQTNSAFCGLSEALSGFDFDGQTDRRNFDSLKDFARSVVEEKAKEEVAWVPNRMVDRFDKFLNHESARVWTGKEDIQAIIKTARFASLKLLCVMAAIRLDGDADDIEYTLAGLVDSKTGAISNRSITSADLWTRKTWEKVHFSKTLITPLQCKFLWKCFIADTESFVNQARDAQVKAATESCKKIADRIFDGFSNDKEWYELKEPAESGPVPGFGNKLNLLLNSYLTIYNAEVLCFAEDIRNVWRNTLESNLLKLVEPAYQSMLKRVQYRTLTKFVDEFSHAVSNNKRDFQKAVHDSQEIAMTAFDNDCADVVVAIANWETSSVRDKIQLDIDDAVKKIERLIEEKKGWKLLLKGLMSFMSTIIMRYEYETYGGAWKGALAGALGAASIKNVIRRVRNSRIG